MIRIARWLPRVIAISLTMAWAPCAEAADPTTADCLSASNNSLTLRNQHKLGAARAQLLVCAAPSCPVDIRNECLRRVADVNAAMPTIVFEVKDGAGSDLVAVNVTMDGQSLATQLEGTALSIDPGAHLFSFETTGQPVLTKQLVIREGDKDRRERIVLGPPPPQATVETPIVAASSVVAIHQVDQSARPFGTQKKVALVAGGVGALGIGIGTAFAIEALSKRNEASRACAGLCADANGTHLWQSAHSAGNISTIAYAFGIAGLATGAALWFTAPSKESARTAQVGFGLGMIEVGGSW